MFFNEEDLYIPKCCDQKYFRVLRDEVRKNGTTFTWTNNDYGLSRYLGMLLTDVPVSTVTLALQSVDVELLEGLACHMNRSWYCSEDGVNRHLLESLRIIIPENKVGEFNQWLQIHKNLSTRVAAYIGNFATTVCHVANRNHQVILQGSISQTETTSKMNHCLTISIDKQMVYEVSSILRVNMHKPIGG